MAGATWEKLGARYKQKIQELQEASEHASRGPGPNPLDYSEADASLNMTDMVRLGLDSEQELREVRDKIKRYVDSHVESKTHEELKKTYGTLLYRMAVADAEIQTKDKTIRQLETEIRGIQEGQADFSADEMQLLNKAEAWVTWQESSKLHSSAGEAGNNAAGFQRRAATQKRTEREDPAVQLIKQDIKDIFDQMDQVSGESSPSSDDVRPMLPKTSSEWAEQDGGELISALSPKGRANTNRATPNASQDSRPYSPGVGPRVLSARRALLSSSIGREYANQPHSGAVVSGNLEDYASYAVSDLCSEGAVLTKPKTAATVHNAVSQLPLSVQKLEAVPVVKPLPISSVPPLAPPSLLSAHQGLPAVRSSRSPQLLPIVSPVSPQLASPPPVQHLLASQQPVHHGHQYFQPVMALQHAGIQRQSLSASFASTPSGPHLLSPRKEPRPAPPLSGSYTASPRQIYHKPSLTPSIHTAY